MIVISPHGLMDKMMRRLKTELVVSHGRPSHDDNSEVHYDGASRDQEEYGRDSDSGYTTDFDSRPSRRLDDYSTYSRTPATASPQASLETTLGLFLRTLQELQVPGPIELLSDIDYLGEGGQFTVYTCQAVSHFKDGPTAQMVAVKRPNFPDGEGTDLSMADRKARRHLHHAYLEVKTLAAPNLREHPNLVKILGWSILESHWRKGLVLIVELAYKDLDWFLKNDRDVDFELRRYLCHDVASGLDAIHGCQISHHDLKPANVLLFQMQKRLVAKLSDFGFAMQVEGEIDFLGGTTDWQAPEAHQKQKAALDPILADIYSYGLLVRRAFMSKVGDLYWRQDGDVRSCASYSLEAAWSLEHDFVKKLLKSLQQTLNLDPKKRPTVLRKIPLFDGLRIMDITSHITSKSTEIESRNQRQLVSTQNAAFAWEFQPVWRSLMDDIFQEFKASRQNENHFSGMTLFAMFLACTVGTPPVPDPVEAAIDLFETCVQLGYAPAAGVVGQVRSYYGIDQSGRSKSNEHWQQALQLAVATGSVSARAQLKKHDRSLQQESIRQFRSDGGYCMFYLDVNIQVFRSGTTERAAPDESPDWPGYTLLHKIATYGSLAELRDHLAAYPNTDLDTRGAYGETPLYLASMRGHTSITRELLHRGADASIRTSWKKITCVHWIFNFMEEMQPVVLDAMLAQGAQLEASTDNDDMIPFFHFPFALPAGTALHWAVALSANHTVQLLLEKGANPLSRNGADPYKYDRCFRLLSDQGPNYGTPSPSSYFHEGLSSLDLAASQREPFLWEWLSHNKSTVDVDSKDERGLTAVHRLAFERPKETTQGVLFSPHPFRSSDVRQDTRRCMKLAQSMGADLNAISAVLRGPLHTRLENFTPLMLAARNEDVDALEALLELGADVHFQNNLGQTALLCIGMLPPPPRLSNNANVSSSRSAQSARILLDYGADVNHTCSGGKSAAYIAAQNCDLRLLDVLLKHGADIEHTIPKGGIYREGDGILGSLALANDSGSREYDKEVAHFLGRYLSGLRDPEKIRRITEQADIEGHRPIHKFAAAAMPNSLKVLLDQGVCVNTLMTSWRTNKEAGKLYVHFREMTALDHSLDWMQERELNHLGGSFTPRDLDAACSLHQEVNELLLQHGALQASPEVIKLVYPDEIDESRDVELRRAAVMDFIRTSREKLSTAT